MSEFTNGGNIRKGQYIMYNGHPHAVLKADFVSPGKGSAFTRTKIKNLQSGAVLEFTYKTTEKVELADVESVEMQYIYFDGTNHVFMNPRTYEQMEVSDDLVGDYADYLKEEMIVYVQLHDNKPIGVFPPQKVILKVVESEDAVAGDRANAPKKPAKLETGATIMVPLFVKVGDMIIVDPEAGTYVSRANGEK